MYAPPVKDSQQANTFAPRNQSAGQRDPRFAPSPDLARLHALIQNSPRATAQLKIPAHALRGVVQMQPADVTVFGSTHLVAPDETGSLMEGEETAYVEDGEKLEIDRDDSLQSARGPHQETYRSEDRKREDKNIKNYKWFKVLKVNGEALDETSYLRDETFTYVDKSIHLEDDAVNEDLSTKIEDDGMTDVYVKAHGLGSVTDITANQKTYQQWLQRHYSKGQIMDMHRSLGLEYEFATFASKSGKPPGIPAHVELGKSSALSSLFNMPFALESDTGNELEAVTPPLLVADSDTGINKGAANRIYMKYKHSLEALRDKTGIGTELTKLDYSAAGLGDGWTFTGPMQNLCLDNRDKHLHSPGRVYSQMNISLTAEEIADFTKERSKEKSSLSQKAVARAFGAVLPLLEQHRDAALDAHVPDEERAEATQALNAANTNLSKGLAGLVSIPSILAKNEGINQTKTSLFSSVKEYCGIWLKDSIPNLVDNTLAQAAARAAMRAVIQAATAEVKNALDTEVNNELGLIKDDVKEWFSWPFRKTERAEEKLAGYKATYERELTATFNGLLDRLNNEAPELQDTQAPVYGQEKFGNQGLGVRKDTFVNIPGGANRKLHLAEMRKDQAIEQLLGGSRRQR